MVAPGAAASTKVEPGVALVAPDELILVVAVMANKPMATEPISATATVMGKREPMATEPIWVTAIVSRKREPRVAKLVLSATVMGKRELRVAKLALSATVMRKPEFRTTEPTEAGMQEPRVTGPTLVAAIEAIMLAATLALATARAEPELVDREMI